MVGAQSFLFFFLLVPSMWRGLLNLLRFIVFVISSGTLACHVGKEE